MARCWRRFADLVTVRFLLTHENRPAHLFGGLGLLSMVLGGLALGYLAVVKVSGEAINGRPLLIVAVLLVSVGLQLVLLGLLVDLGMRSRNSTRRERR